VPLVVSCELPRYECHSNAALAFESLSSEAVCFPEQSGAERLIFKIVKTVSHLALGSERGYLEPIEFILCLTALAGCEFSPNPAA
jgi:hypothetical protein